MGQRMGQHPAREAVGMTFTHLLHDLVHVELGPVTLMIDPT